MCFAASDFLIGTRGGFATKGCDGIEKASIARESELRTVVGQSVRVKCR